MRYEAIDERAKEVSDKELLASVTEEMTEPRMTQSARVNVDELSTATPGPKLARTKN